MGNGCCGGKKKIKQPQPQNVKKKQPIEDPDDIIQLAVQKRQLFRVDFDITNIFPYQLTVYCMDYKNDLIWNDSQIANIHNLSNFNSNNSILNNKSNLKIKPIQSQKISPIKMTRQPIQQEFGHLVTPKNQQQRKFNINDKIEERQVQLQIIDQKYNHNLKSSNKNQFIQKQRQKLTLKQRQRQQRQKQRMNVYL